MPHLFVAQPLVRRHLRARNPVANRPKQIGIAVAVLQARIERGAAATGVAAASRTVARLAGAVVNALAVGGRRRVRRAGSSPCRPARGCCANSTPAVIAATVSDKFAPILHSFRNLNHGPHTLFDEAARQPGARFQPPRRRHERIVSRDEAAGPKGLLVMFICRHCPFVKHVQDELARLGPDYAGRGVGIVAISANDESGFPGRPAEKLAEMSQSSRFHPSRFCFSTSRRTWRARTTRNARPISSSLTRAGPLVYRGQLDDSRPGSGIPVTGRDLRAALDSLCRRQTDLPQSAGQPPAATSNGSHEVHVTARSASARFGTARGQGRGAGIAAAGRR